MSPLASCENRMSEKNLVLEKNAVLWPEMGQFTAKSVYSTLDDNGSDWCVLFLVKNGQIVSNIEKIGSKWLKIARFGRK